MNLSSYLLVHESPQMTVLKLVLGGTIFTEGGHYSPVNNVQGDILGGGGGGGGGGTLYTMTTSFQLRCHQNGYNPVINFPSFGD